MDTGTTNHTPDNCQQTPKVADPPFDDTRADFVLISSDGVAFYVLSTILSLSSPVFEIMFKLPQGGLPELYEGKPFVKVIDESHKLRLLLTWCDPRCSTRLKTLSDIQTVLEIADKYGMEGILQLVGTTLCDAKDMIALEPLRVFAVAVRFRLQELMVAAAAEAIKTPFKQWKRCSEMKNISAFAYDTLVRHQRHCTTAARRVVTHPSWVRRASDSDFVLSLCDTDECVIKKRSGAEYLEWFLDYLDLVDRALKNRPDGAAATDVDVLAKALDTLADSDCDTCLRDGPGSLLRLSHTIRDEINSRIKDVCFKLED